MRISGESKKYCALITSLITSKAPFTMTNLIVIESDGEAIVVDPGANREGLPHFEKVSCLYTQ